MLGAVWREVICVCFIKLMQTNNRIFFIIILVLNKVVIEGLCIYMVLKDFFTLLFQVLMLINLFYALIRHNDERNNILFNNCKISFVGKIYFIKKKSYFIHVTYITNHWLFLLNYTSCSKLNIHILILSKTIWKNKKNEIKCVVLQYFS
jgi:hypothetical protein